MNFKEYIANYLDDEGFVQRSHEEVLRFVRTKISLQAASELDQAVDSWTEGRIDEEKFYAQMCRFAGDTAFYDLLKSRLRNFVQPVLEKVINGSTNDLTTLDIGCGTGLEACLFAETLSKNAVSIGIDSLEPMLEVARKRAERRRLSNCRFQLGDRDKLDFPDNYFNLVFCQNSLASLEECDGYGIQTELAYGMILSNRLKEMYRVVKPGGKAVLVNMHSNPDYGVKDLSGRMNDKGFGICQSEVIRGLLDEMEISEVFVVGEKN